MMGSLNRWAMSYLEVTMPLYHDLSQARRLRLLHPWHIFALAQYLLAFKGESYWERGHTPRAVHELTEADITGDMIVIWALVREELARDVAEDFMDRHAELTSREDDEAVECGRMAPTLYEILKRVLSKNDFIAVGKIYAPAADCRRARRDIEGFIGTRVAACEAKLELDQVFAATS